MAGMEVGSAAPFCLKTPSPSPYHAARLAGCAYDHGHLMHNTFHSLGYRVYKDGVFSDSGLRMAMAVPAWFPTREAASSFNFQDLGDADVKILFVFRGTDVDLLGNLRADWELIASKFNNAGTLPAIAEQASSNVSMWLQHFLTSYPQLARRGTRLDILATGHSLGGYLAEAVTVMLDRTATQHKWRWRCTTFESPGLPERFNTLAERTASPEHWKSSITTYLSAPNPINTLHRHLGNIIHVLVPFPMTVWHVAKCTVADAVRTVYWWNALQSLYGALSQLWQGGPAAGAASAGAARMISWTGIQSSLGEWAQCTTRVLASTMGVEVQELMQQHKMDHMYSCFDCDDGHLKEEFRRDMVSWPVLGLDYAVHSIAPRWLVPSYIPTFHTNMGWYNVADRQGMILRRCKMLPGYVPKDEDADARTAMGRSSSATAVQLVEQHTTDTIVVD